VYCTFAGLLFLAGPGCGSDYECLPITCEIEGKDCGIIDDGCGGTVDCGECVDDPCAPDPCGGKAQCAIGDCEEARCDLDCLAGHCDVLTIEGERPPQAGSFHGFADPSVRADPTVPDRLWLGYTVPRVQVLDDPHGPGDIMVFTTSIHLARSDDAGASWTLVKALWPAEETTEPGGSAIGFSGHEVVSLLPVQLGDSTSWFSVRAEYFEQGKAGYHPLGTTFSFHIARADTPPDLATAPVQRLGSSFALPGLVDVDLNSLSPTLAHCGFWNEPALYSENGKLYLLGQCQVYAGAVPDPAKTRTVVFSANLQTDVTRLDWSYVGVLADATLARKLGVEKLMQAEIARGNDGQLLAFLNPSYYDQAYARENHEGCRILELASIDPPVVRETCGKPAIRAVITASDQDFGTGSCGYDPASATGVILTRRPDPVTTPNSGFAFHRTLIHP
jgi:hypothetical protein